MGKTIQLKDGSEVLIRPLERKDLEQSLAFFRALPKEDLNYLRGDPTQREMVENRIREVESGEYDRLIAVVGDKIVGEGALEMTGRDWTSHVGELRLIVAQEYRRKGLGIVMAHALFTLAASCQLEQVMVTMMRPQTAARSIFHKLGFREELVLPDHVRARDGESQDLILMRCDLKALWQELDSTFG